MTRAIVAALQRWPVKGLGPDRLASVELEADRPFPFDRAWAIENGPSGFDPEAPAFLPKIKFLMLMKNARLAALETRFDAGSRTLEIRRGGRRVAGGRLDDPTGRAVLEQFFAAYMAADLRGPPKLLAAPNHSFSDCGENVVSVVNLASLRELERVAGRPLDPLRFRANIHVEGLAPWEEVDLIGTDVGFGDEVVLRFARRITRCAATDVDPDNGVRDTRIPRLLASAFAQEDFGVYARVVRRGSLGEGMALSRAPGDQALASSG